MMNIDVDPGLRISTNHIMIENLSHRKQFSKFIVNNPEMLSSLMYEFVGIRIIISLLSDKDSLHNSINLVTNFIMSPIIFV